MKKYYVRIDKDGQVLNTLKTSAKSQCPAGYMEITENEYQTAHTKLFDADTNTWVDKPKRIVEKNPTNKEIESRLIQLEVMLNEIRGRLK